MVKVVIVKKSKLAVVWWQGFDRGSEIAVGGRGLTKVVKWQWQGSDRSGEMAVAGI
jgi:hypothetical protein